MTGDDMTNAWLADAWARHPDEFRTDVEDAGIACRGWNLAATDLPGIVLVHGFRAHARWWDHVAPALAETHRVVALDLSGMGDSDRRASYSRAQHGREALGAARAAGIERPIVIAHSYGAIASLLLCAQSPNAVRRIIVLDGALPIPGDEGHMIPTPPERRYPDRESAIARFRLSPPGAWPNPDILRYVAEHSVMQRNDGQWGWKFDNDAALSLNRDVWRDTLRNLPTPADVVYGDRSEIFTPERRAMVPLILPRCGRLIALPTAHHYLMIEQPLALVAALRALVANDKS